MENAMSWVSSSQCPQGLWHVTSTLKPEPLAFVVVILTLQNVKRSKYHCNLNKSVLHLMIFMILESEIYQINIWRFLQHKKITPIPCFCSASAEVFSGKTEPSEDGMKMKSMKSWHLMIYYTITRCRLNHPLEKYARRIKHNLKN